MWGLSNSSHPNADIHAVAAWNVTTGSPANVVGVVDTGVDYNHPDLAPNMWSAPATFTVTVGGAGGRTITCPVGSHGYNAILGSCDPMDDNDHGTHTAGTIGAVGNNGIGVAGVNWSARIMAREVPRRLGQRLGGRRDRGDRLCGAGKTGLRVERRRQRAGPVQYWGGGGFSARWTRKSRQRGRPTFSSVAAAGNQASNNDALPFYPASFLDANVVAVAASDETDALSSSSNFGANAQSSNT